MERCSYQEELTVKLAPPGAGQQPQKELLLMSLRGEKSEMEERDSVERRKVQEKKRRAMGEEGQVGEVQ